MEPMYLTRRRRFYEPEGKGDVVGCMIEEATIEGQAKIQNDLAANGDSCETLLAGSPFFWQRKMSRALLCGFAAGVFCVLIVQGLWP